jgi:hypothetical protein
MTRILFVGQKPETVDFSDPSLPTRPRYAGRSYLSDDRREFGGSFGGARLAGFRLTARAA